MAGIGHRGFMGRKKGGGVGPMFMADGVAFSPTTSAFIDFDGFDEITGSGDYTFMAWYKFDTLSAGNQAVLFSQNTQFLNGSNRLSINSDRIEVNTTVFAEDLTVRNDGDAQCIVVKKSSGTTYVFYLVNGSFIAYTGLSVPDVATPTQSSIGSTLTNGIYQTNCDGKLLSIQIANSALSDGDIQALMENYDVLPSSTASLPFYTNLSGSDDNGAYPAPMTSSIVPSHYVVSASFEAEPAYRAFDGNWNLRTILRAAGGSGSAGTWLKIDLGSGNEQAIDKYLFRSFSGQGLNSFTVAGSNDDSTYTDLFTGNGANNFNIIQEFTWTNSTTYRYYRITCNSGFNATQWTHYQSVLIDQSKEWQSGGGFAKDGTMIFPT